MVYNVYRTHFVRINIAFDGVNHCFVYYKPFVCSIEINDL